MKTTLRKSGALKAAATKQVKGRRRIGSGLRRSAAAVPHAGDANELDGQQQRFAFLMAFVVASAACTAVAGICLIFQPLA